MNARLELKMRILAIMLTGGLLGGLVFVISRGHTTAGDLRAGIVYGLLISSAIAVFELFIANGALREQLGRLPFTLSVLVRSAIYAAIIIPIQYYEIGAVLAGVPVDDDRASFWSATIYSGLFSIAMNLVLAITNLIGTRALSNFITGRYHSPVQENRFVLFVDIAGSTGLAERLGGVGIHRFLDRTFRLLTLQVADFRGEVLHYVGDEVIVTWPERSGAVDCRPLRCFLAMREALAGAAPQFAREFGAAPQIRGSLHFGTVTVGEIGDIKRAIVFNGDVMNIAARLEQSSRDIAGGFLASRAALLRFGAPPPVPLCDLGRLPIRGRADGIDVMGLAEPALATAAASASP
ncbi:adenylate cyclase [Rhodopseudomonas rhenobacensis]|uniref:Adenylate cyclase n=1 Tax=Rhodopseudomonas rhenobacensis TaxID=87461 RepID=A0A7W7Z173_9BRAD|nr:adenylate/guanylate cyclase domain-containing protein [Rhodopseudomonas rhenobacensis]MBB5046019.1 adenylate cyclase [Rhodopseudomonas rhenobacensis]